MELEGDQKSNLYGKIKSHFSSSGSSPSIDEMLVMVAYNGTRGLAGKRSLISQCRAVAKRYPEFLVSVFDTDSRTADIMDAVDPLVWR